MGLDIFISVIKVTCGHLPPFCLFTALVHGLHSIALPLPVFSWTLACKNKFSGHVSYAGILSRPDRMKFDTKTLEVSDGWYGQGPKHT